MVGMTAQPYLTDAHLRQQLYNLQLLQQHFICCSANLQAAPGAQVQWELLVTAARMEP